MKRYIQTITDLLVGAAYADKRLEGKEMATLRKILLQLTDKEELPASISDQIAAFAPAHFNPQQSAASMSEISDEEKRHVLEMVSAIHDADDEVDLAEDRYLQAVATGLGLDVEAYKDLSLQFSEITESEELQGILA